MINLNTYIIEKLKINKNTENRDPFEPHQGDKGIVVSKGKTKLCSLYLGKIFDVHENANEFIFDYNQKDIPIKKDIHFYCVDNENYVAKEQDNDNLFFYDKEFCLKMLEQMLKEKSNKKYIFDDSTILIPKDFEFDYYINILKYYLEH